VVINEAYETGRTSSLQAGLRALPAETEAFVLFPVDHALVETETVRSLIEAWRASRKSIVVPACGGRRGHPVVCGSSLVPEFLSLAPDAPARQVTSSDPARIHHFETQDEEVLRDLDTPADYHDALEVYSARGGEAGFLAPKGAGGRPAPKRPPVG
jgi:molybdenum cofactor cytidylyltransferase